MRLNATMTIGPKMPNAMSTLGRGPIVGTRASASVSSNSGASNNRNVDDTTGNLENMSANQTPKSDVASNDVLIPIVAAVASVCCIILVFVAGWCFVRQRRASSQSEGPFRDPAAMDLPAVTSDVYQRIDKGADSEHYTTFAPKEENYALSFKSSDRKNAEGDAQYLGVDNI